MWIARHVQLPVVWARPWKMSNVHLLCRKHFHKCNVAKVSVESCRCSVLHTPDLFKDNRVSQLWAQHLMRSQFLSPVLASIRAFKVGLLDLADLPLQSCKFCSAPKSPWQPAATWDTFSMFVMIFSSPRCSERDFNTINVTLWIAKHEVICGRKSGVLLFQPRSTLAGRGAEKVVQG